MLPLYTTLPEFELPDVRTGRMLSSTTFDGHPLLVVFLCVHCPYVKRIQDGIAAFGKDYENTELKIVGIASNDIGAHPEDAPENQARVAAEIGINFPILSTSLRRWPRPSKRHALPTSSSLTPIKSWFIEASSMMRARATRST